MLSQAQVVATRAAIERGYTGVADIYTITRTQDARHVTVMRRQKTLAGIPCRISYQSTGAGVDAGEITQAAQNVKLFCAPEYVIPAGSEIIVTQDGRAITYTASGQTSHYPTHQEIPLEVANDRA